MRWRLDNNKRFARQQPIDLPRLCENDSTVVTFLTLPQDTAAKKLELLSVHYLAVLLASSLLVLIDCGQRHEDGPRNMAQRRLSSMCHS
jgi:hypothetical protein